MPLKLPIQGSGNICEEESMEWTKEQKGRKYVLRDPIAASSAALKTPPRFLIQSAPKLVLKITPKRKVSYIK